MACAMGSDDQRENYKKAGLAGDHAYTLIGAYDLEGNRIVKVRNPWGQFEWKGDWGDNDYKWTPSMKKAVNFVK